MIEAKVRIEPGEQLLATSLIDETVSVVQVAEVNANHLLLVDGRSFYLDGSHLSERIELSLLTPDVPARLRRQHTLSSIRDVVRNASDACLEELMHVLKSHGFESRTYGVEEETKEEDTPPEQEH